jgi:hypothetical protein
MLRILLPLHIDPTPIGEGQLFIYIFYYYSGCNVEMKEITIEDK